MTQNAQKMACRVAPRRVAGENCGSFRRRQGRANDPLSRRGSVSDCPRRPIRSLEGWPRARHRAPKRESLTGAIDRAPSGAGSSAIAAASCGFIGVGRSGFAARASTNSSHRRQMRISRKFAPGSGRLKAWEMGGGVCSARAQNADEIVQRAAARGAIRVELKELPRCCLLTRLLARDCGSMQADSPADPW